jgi:hypothetical protein
MQCIVYLQKDLKKLKHSMKRGKLNYARLYTMTFLKVQHGNFSPICPFHFASSTIASCLGMVSTSLLQSSSITKEEAFLIWDHNSIIPFSGVLYQFNLLFQIDRRDFMEFKFVE